MTVIMRFLVVKARSRVLSLALMSAASRGYVGGDIAPTFWAGDINGFALRDVQCLKILFVASGFSV